MTRIIVCFLALATTALFAGTAQAVVANTVHNLSVSGPGAVRATSETEICIFCHTPHRAAPSGPLWNRRDPGATYTPYSSSTAAASPGQPTGASILCLSCHDGTIALGDVLSRTQPIPLAGGVTTIPSGPGRLGTDLSDDHPISFVYSSGLASQNGELVDPSALTGVVRLDASGQLQCTSCHDPHDDTYGRFLVMDNTGSTLCRTCHVKDGWNQTPHNLSGAGWNNIPPDPWPAAEGNTVSDNACQNCHRPHSAGGRERLLNFQVEEDNCIACHNGNVANENVWAEFSKATRHPVQDNSGVHDPSEPAVISARHVECADCHNPHAARAGGGTPPGPLTRVRGVSSGGSEIDPLTEEYQLCYRCHGDSPNRPPPPTTRQIAQTNTRLEFDPVNPSFHPVESVGRNGNVPSLIAPLNENSRITCSDCHNNDSGPNAGGGGPNGPHGSIYNSLLERQYLTQDPTPESQDAYALCYKCHDRNSILNDESFSEHSRHITGREGGMGGGGMGGGGMGGLSTPCNVCHDPHGISATQGNATNNSNLINFDTSVVQPNRQGQLRFEDRGQFAGACYLSCHNRNHNPETYP